MSDETAPTVDGQEISVHVGLPTLIFQDPVTGREIKRVTPRVIQRTPLPKEQDDA